MKCSWVQNGIVCEKLAIEKWTEIPYICPYTGPFDVDIVPYVAYRCAMHSAEAKAIYKTEEVLKQCQIVEKINEY